MSKKLLNPKEAAEFIGGTISDQTLRRYARAGELPGYAFPFGWAFDPDELSEWMKKHYRGVAPSK